MSTGDVALTALVIALLPVCFWQPWLGVLVFSWLGYMNPHRLMHGFAYSMPFAKMVAIPTLLGLIRIRHKVALPRAPEVWLIVALWGTFALSTWLTAIQPVRAWAQLSSVSKVLLMTLVTMALFQERRKIRLLLLVIAGSIGFYGVTGGIWAIYTSGHMRLVGPPQSVISDNNGLGLILVIVLPLFVYLRYEEARSWLRHLLLAAFGLSILAIWATYSRGAFLVLGVVLAMLLVKTRLRDRALLAVLLVDLAVVTLAPPKWVARIASIPTAHRVDGSGVQRLKSWSVAYHLGLDHPFLGAGFRPFSPEIYERYMPGYWDYHDAHNHYLQVFAEHGFTGLMLFIALIGSVFVTLRRAVRATRGDPNRQWIYHYAHALEVCTVAYVAGGVFLNLPYLDLFYQLVAVAVVLQHAAGPAAAPTRFFLTMAERRARCGVLVRRYYAGVPTRETLLDEAVTPVLGATATLLDVGCGRDAPLLHRFAKRVRFGVGVDRERPDCGQDGGTALVVCDLTALPFRAGVFDALISRSVIEHLEDPVRAFRELRRVVAARGRIVLTTPNKYDYPSVVARLLPDAWSEGLLRWALGDARPDHFPVFYRANTPGALRRIASQSRLALEDIRAVRHYPVYFVFSPMLFRLGMLYDWVITRLRLDRLQPTWLVVMRPTDDL